MTKIHEGWEEVHRTKSADESRTFDITCRMKVPGGWIYRYSPVAYFEGENAVDCMIFVPNRYE